jgi:hypothetical protein
MVIVMTERDSSNRKASLLQIRVELPLVEQLNALSDSRNLPLSVLLRSWISERLRDELKLIDEDRNSWQDKRFTEIQNLIQSPNFAEGPVLVIHAFPLTPGVVLDPEAIQPVCGNLAPLEYRLPGTGRINRLGFELYREHGDKIRSKGQAFKTGQLESIYTINFQGKEILGMALDHGIVSIVHAFIGLLAGQRVPFPYLFRISLFRIKGYWLTINPTLFSSIPHVDFQEDFFTLPDVIYSDVEQVKTMDGITKQLKPALDELWNASGLPASASFNNSDQWIERR